MCRSQRSKWIGASTSEAKLERYWWAGLYTVSCLAQGEVSEGELPVAAAEEREESKHVEQEGDHRTEILSGSDLTDQRLGPGRGFGEGQWPGLP
jgi:hypothetical protein